MDILKIAEELNKAGLMPLESCSDGGFRRGADGVAAISRTADGKVEFIRFEARAIAPVRSAPGYPSYYPVHDEEIGKPVPAVLMGVAGIEDSGAGIGSILLAGFAPMGIGGGDIHCHG